MALAAHRAGYRVCVENCRCLPKASRDRRAATGRLGTARPAKPANEVTTDPDSVKLAPKMTRRVRIVVVRILLNFALLPSATGCAFTYIYFPNLSLNHNLCLVTGGEIPHFQRLVLILMLPRPSAPSTVNPSASTRQWHSALCLPFLKPA
jgi:hypothetical protein